MWEDIILFYLGFFVFRRMSIILNLFNKGFESVVLIERVKI